MDPASHNARPATPAAASREAADLPQANLLQIVWDGRWLVGWVTAGMLALAVLYLLITPLKYTARSRLFVEQSGPRLLSDQGRIERKSAVFMNTQAEFITSMPILANAMKQVGDTVSFGDSGDPIARLQQKIVASVGKQDEIITISLELPSVDEAERIVGAVVDSYVAHHTESNRSTASEMVKMLRKERSSREREVDALMREMTAFQRAHGAVSLDSNFDMKERLGRLGDALTAAQVQAHETHTAFESARKTLSSPDGVNQLIESQQIQGGRLMDREYADLLESRARLEADLAQLEQRWGSAHRNVKTSRAAVDALKVRIDEKRRRFAWAHLMELHRRSQAAKDMVEQMQQAYTQTQRGAAEHSEKVAEHQRMKAELAQLDEQRATLDRRIQELSVSEDAGALNISVLEPASADINASSPRKAQTLGAAMVIGLLLGVFVAVIRDWLDLRFRGSDQIKATLGLPVLSMVPKIRGQYSQAQIGQMVHVESTAVAAEAFRDIRTAIKFSNRDVSLRTLVVASSLPNEGKTTVASNLAIAMAQAGQRVLLVDADLRNPTLHEIFQFDNHTGLASVLSGKDEFNEAIQRTAIEHLDLLASGPAPHNPSEVLNSQSLITSLEAVSDQYDVVLLDSPPVMNVTDTRILGAICDGTVMVVRPSVSERRVCQAACESLQSVGARIVGVVANDVPSNYGYASRRYYGDRSRKPIDIPLERKEWELPHAPVSE